MKKLASILIVLALVLTMASAAMAEGEKVAVICDPVGTNMFLTQAVDMAKDLQETYGYTLSLMECSDTDEWQSNYRAAVAEGYDLIIGVGWQSGELANEMATEYPDASAYAVIDTDAGNENVMSISYNEEQAAYLMGVMAGLAFPESELYGYIGCFEGGGSFKYRWGFCEGVRSVNPDAQFIFNYTNSYTDTALPYEYAKQQAAAGATYIFGGAAAGNEGIFQAALELAAKLKECPVVVTAKAGAGEKLFGSVTTQEISNAIRDQYGFDIAKTKLVSEPIKAFGTYDVKCKLGYEITGVVKVTVKPEE